MLKNPLPPRARKILKIIGDDCERIDLLKGASGLAYTTLLGLVPALAITLGVISLATPLFRSEISDAIQHAKSFVISNLAVGSGEIVIEKMEDFLSRFDLKKLGFGGFVGLLVSLSLLLKQIEMSFNIVWKIETPRSLLRRFVSFWSFLSLSSLGLCLFVAAIVDLNATTGFSGTNLFSAVQIHFSGLGFLALTVGTFTLAYKIIPNKSVATLPAFKGAFFAAVLLLAVSKTYAGFSVKLTNYESIYGAFAAVPLFLMWLYILWTITLFGCLLSYRFDIGWSENMLNHEPQDPEIKELDSHSLLDRVVDSLSKPELEYLNRKMAIKSKK